MNLPTILVFSLVAVILILIIVKGIIDRKKGKTSCSCGGCCKNCSLNCSVNETKEN
jgi:hypothetical protein